MSEPASPCRLFVYLARQAPIGIVLRRGPSDWVRLSRWHTDTDEVEPGQWMKNRVYERRSDVSPDGSLFLAFARGSSGPVTSTDAVPNRDTWVAISRAPFFTALALWFVGGTYCAGGFFPDPRTAWLGFAPTPPDQGRLPDWLTATTSREGYVDRTPNWTERTVWFNRLLRDGWRRVEGSMPETWARPNPAATLTLLMSLRSDADFAAYGGPHVVEYAVRPTGAANATPLGRADWADWDQRGRLVLAQGGRLWHWRSPADRRLIADVNDQRPDPRPAPPWARAWPEPPPAT